jgi:hypothetical protein
MKPLRWAFHARKKATVRKIDPREVEDAVTNPDRILPGQPPRKVHVRRYHDRELGVDMLLCAVVEETQQERVIVTVYKTSRFEKYITEGKQ